MAFGGAGEEWRARIQVQGEPMRGVKRHGRVRRKEKTAEERGRRVRVSRSAPCSSSARVLAIPSGASGNEGEKDEETSFVSVGGFRR